MGEIVEAGNVLPFSNDPKLASVQDFVSEESNNNPLSFLLRQIKGRVHKLVLPAIVAGLLFGAVGYSLKAPTYETNGLIKISATQSSILKEEQHSGRSKHFDTFVEGELRYLKSHEVANEVIQTLQKEYNQEITVKKLNDLIKVKRDKSLISLTATGEDKDYVTLVLDTMISSYLRLHHNQFRDRRNYREQELLVREAELLKDLELVNQQMLEVGGAYGVATLLKAHVIKVEQLEELDQRISDLRNQILELETIGEDANLDSIATEIKRSILRDHALADMVYDQSTRAATLMRLESRYQNDHPKVVAAASELKVMTDLINERRKQITALSRTGVRAEGSAPEQNVPQLKVLLQRLLSRQDSLSEEAKSLNEKLIQLEFLNKESNAIRVLLDETRRILDEVRVESRNALPGVVEIMYRPEKPVEPIKDKRKIFALLGGIVGAMFVSALVIFGWLLKPTVRHEEDILDIGAGTSVLGSLPLMFDVSDESYQQAILSLRNQIQLLRAHPFDENRRARCIAVTGCSASTPVKQTAYAVAESFQVCGLKTLFIEADLVNRIESHEAVPGWWEALTGKKVQAQSVRGLDVLPIGQAGAKSDGAVSLTRVKSAIDHFASDYDVIILDTGSYAGHLSTEIIASQTDINVLLVDAGSSTGKARQISHRLSLHSNNPIQVVLSSAA